jgi:hypothetical protein
VRILAKQAGNGTYAPASAEQDILVMPAILTVTAPPATRPYEGPDPTFTVTVTGLVGGDTLANVITGIPTFTVVSDLGTTPAGTILPVEVNVGTLTLTSPNYVISVVPTTVTVVCCQPQVIVPASAPPAGLPLPVGVPLSLTSSASSGLPVTFTVVAGPGTLGTDPLGGTTLTATGPGPITVQVTQAGNSNTGAAAPFTVTINSPVTINPGTILPAGVLNAAYPQVRFTASGGTTPYGWTATGMPPGLSINPATGIVTGIPTSAAGSPYNAVITVTDHNGITASQHFSIPVATSPLAITTPSLPASAVGMPYPFTTITASGGTGGYTWSITGLPPGLTTDGQGDISGTPITDLGSPFTIGVTVTDSANETVFKPLPLVVLGPLTITTVGPYLPVGVVGSAYPPTTIHASGGTGFYTFSATGLPPGLSITSAGLISAGPGVPAPGGTYNSVVVTVADSSGATASATYTITIVAMPLTITPAGLSTGEVNVPYTTAPFTASGGLAPYTWTFAGLPVGLSPSGAGISGTPTTAVGSPFDIGVTVTDSAREAQSEYFPLTVYPALTITSPVSLPGGAVNGAYPTNTITASGGLAPYVWTATGLPPGLTLDGSNTATTAVVGVPASDAGSPYTVLITIKDLPGGTASKTYSITVLP